MIPDRFVTAFPARCLALLDSMEPEARKQQLVGTFSILAASSILVIPLERLDHQHFLPAERVSELALELRRAVRRPWHAAPFWQSNPAGGWHFSRIVSNPEVVREWVDENGRASMSPEANKIERKRCGDVLRVLRNALAHGNIIYLDQGGNETPETAVHWIAFLSRYEETEDQRAAATTYRLVAVQEEAFLSFVRQWARWLVQLST